MIPGKYKFIKHEVGDLLGVQRTTTTLQLLEDDPEVARVLRPQA